MCQYNLVGVTRLSHKAMFEWNLLKPDPAGTRRLYNVALTSMQRHDVASTL